MNRLTTVLLFELRSTLRRRSYQLSTAALPILAVGLLLVVRLVAAPADDEPEIRGYVDRWGRLPAELPAEAPFAPTRARRRRAPLSWMGRSRPTS